MTHGLNRQLVRRYLGPGLTLSTSVPQPQVVALASALESRRLSAVRRYDILDTPPDGSFDRITALAASLFSVPIAIISIVDHARIWFQSHHGQDVEQIDRAPGLCASAILHTSPWILTDAKHDVRSLANPLVAGEFGLRFHVGVPLRTTDGFNLGTLCVIDREPRPISERQNAQLRISPRSSWTRWNCACRHAGRSPSCLRSSSRNRPPFSDRT